MKNGNHIKFLSSILLMLLICFPVSAQKNHYINVWGGAGYSSLYHGIDNTKVPGGFGAEIGAGYELNLNKLILLGGLEFQYQNSKTTMNGYREGREYLYLPIADHKLTYWYTFNEYNEKHNIGFMNIPLQVGYRFDRYFFLAGAKIGFGIFGKYKTNSTINIAIEDEQFNEIIEDVGHGTGNYPFTQKGKIDVGFNIAPTVEVGMYLDEWIYKNTKKRGTAPSYRVSVFADYGVMNLNKGNTNNDILTAAKADPADVSTNSLLSSNLAQDKRFGNLIVGVKFAVSLALPKKTPPPPTSSNFYARVVDAETKENLSAEVTLSMITGKQLFKKTTNTQGVVDYPGLRHSNYQITAKSDGYTDHKKQFRHAKPDTMIIAMNPFPTLHIHVFDEETRENLPAEVTMNATIQGNAEIFKEWTNAQTGMYSYRIKAGGYQVSAIAEGYLFKQETINHTKNDTLHIGLQPIPKEQPIILYDLLFEFGTATIIPESQKSLEELAQLLTNNPNLHIEITGHTDNVGTEAFNLKLSKERAQAVYNRLIEKGISASRLTYDGKGNTEPIDTNDTEEGRQKNRRVEFRILK